MTADEFEELAREAAEAHYEKRAKLFDVKDFDRETIAVESYVLGCEWAREILQAENDKLRCKIESLEANREADGFLIRTLETSNKMLSADLNVAMSELAYIGAQSSDTSCTDDLAEIAREALAKIKGGI